MIHSKLGDFVYLLVDFFVFLGIFQRASSNPVTTPGFVQTCFRGRCCSDLFFEGFCFVGLLCVRFKQTAKAVPCSCHLHDSVVQCSTPCSRSSTTPASLVSITKTCQKRTQPKKPWLLRAPRGTPRTSTHNTHARHNNSHTHNKQQTKNNHQTTQARLPVQNWLHAFPRTLLQPS